MKLIRLVRFVNLRADLAKWKWYTSISVVMAVLALAAPFVTNQYIIDGVLDYFLFYVILAESYDILGGFMGYVDLGITLFFGLGAYFFAIEYFVLHSSLIYAFIISVLLTGIVGFLVSFPMFRLKGFYFAVATLALVPLAYYIFTDPSLNYLTKGISGIGGVTGNYVTSYYAIFGFTVFVIGLILFLSRSRFGLALTSIREDEQIAESSGINTRLLKKVAMTISATLCGLTGCLFAWSQGSVVPMSIFSFTLAFIPVTFALLGGTGTIAGPIIGSAIYSLIDYVIRSPQVRTSALGWTSNYEIAIIGIFLIIVGIFAPGGLMSLSKPIKKFFIGEKPLKQTISKGKKGGSPKAQDKLS